MKKRTKNSSRLTIPSKNKLNYTTSNVKTLIDEHLLLKNKENVTNMTLRKLVSSKQTKKEFVRSLRC